MELCSSFHDSTLAAAAAVLLVSGMTVYSVASSDRRALSLYDIFYYRRDNCGPHDAPPPTSESAPDGAES